ncbi:MAG TPA: MFS transporter [Gemmatimonadaceae bacterium]|jgi:MFS family permease|nr:MFS transporter [Gemmatimonadaceae bacterium]
MTAVEITHVREVDRDGVAPSRSARVARWAVSALFFLTGAGTANWAVRIPAVQERLGLTPGQLGIALLGVSAGAITAMPIAGRLVARHGSRPVTRVAALAFALALALPALAWSFPTLLASLAVLGLANGMLDVAMNAQAATVQRHYRQPIMSRVHALYSFGGLAGAAVGGRAAAFGVAARPHLMMVALVLATASLAFGAGMLPASADAMPEQSATTRLTRHLAALGFVAFCVLFGEGAMANWSAVYLRDVVGAGPGLAAAGFAAFSLTMATGRAVGDALTTHLRPVRLARLGGAIAALGAMLAIAVPQPWAVVVGFGAIGAGLSSIFPIVLAAASRTRDVVPGAAIAAVSMCGYSGLLAGPPLIGAVASALTLRGGLGLVAISCVAVVLFARSLREAASDEPRRRAVRRATPPPAQAAPAHR